MSITAEVLAERNIKITASWEGDFYGKRIFYRFHYDKLHEFVVNDTVEKEIKYRYCGFYLFKTTFKFSKFKKSMTKSKNGRKLLTLNVWITDPQPDTSHKATISIKSLWRKLEEIEKLKTKIEEDQKRPRRKQFYNRGNTSRIEEKPVKKTKPLFAAAGYDSDESETGEVFVTKNIMSNDDW